MNPYNIDNRPGSTHATIAAAIGTDQRVLDIGCNEGYLAELASPTNSFHGLDADAAAVAEAKTRYVDAVVADLDELESIPWSETFDVVVLADILEHLLRPERLLRQLLDDERTQDARFVISLPNIANWSVRLHLLSGRFDYQDAGILDRTHLRFYTFRTAADLLQSVGLDVHDVQSGASVLAPVIRRLPFTRRLLSTSIILTAQRR